MKKCKIKEPKTIDDLEKDLNDLMAKMENEGATTELINQINNLQTTIEIKNRNFYQSLKKVKQHER